MISSMDLQRPRVTAVLPEWDLGVVLEDLSKAPYEPPRPSFTKAPQLQVSLPLCHGFSKKIWEFSVTGVQHHVL